MAANTGSRLILYGLLGTTALFLLLILGPLGLVLAPLILVVVGLVHVLLFDDEGSETQSPVNCDDCGAPNPADAEVCDYCGAAL